MTKKISFMARLFVILFLCVFAKQGLMAQETYDSFRLVVLGDSLSSGYQLSKSQSYVSLLQEALIKDGLDNVAVVDAAISGQTTADGLKMMDAVLDKQPHAAIVELGANDFLHHLSPEQAEKNLDAIITRFLDNDIPVMLIGIQIPLILNLSEREALTKMYKNLEQKHDLILYPNFLEGVLIERFGAYDLKYMQNDATHPTAEGVNIMVQKTYPVVKKFLMSL